MNNLRNLKLWLTTEIINHQNDNSNILHAIRDLMNTVKEQAGKFLEIILTDSQPFNGGIVRQQYAIRYENCTLDLDLMTNKVTRQEYLSNFNLR
ncbi:MAG: hypothetical protein AAFV95_26085 [Bacteroidota bacterium]